MTTFIDLLLITELPTPNQWASYRRENLFAHPHSIISIFDLNSHESELDLWDTIFG